MCACSWLLKQMPEALQPDGYVEIVGCHVDQRARSTERSYPHGVF